jgi:sigma-E factor negative regulatory protein RseA
MEQISALMDNELGEHDTRQALLRLGDNEDARARWAAYHLIGDVLRGQHAAVEVAARVSRALEAEPTVLAPRRAARAASRTMTFALSAAASLSAIAVVGWMAFSTQTVSEPAAELAAATAAPAAEPQLVSAPANGTVNDYLLAHQGVSPSSGLQGVAPYIRTISAQTAAER